MTKMKRAITILILASCLNSACADKDPVAVLGPKEPPQVTMPNPSIADLTSATTFVVIDDKTIRFMGDTPPGVYRFTGQGDFDRSTRLAASVTVDACTWRPDESCEVINEVRLDFAWVVRGGEIWAVEVIPRGDGYVVWNDWLLTGWANQGPEWAFGTEVIAVVGLTDLLGNVHLVGASTTVEERSRF